MVTAAPHRTARQAVATLNTVTRRADEGGGGPVRNIRYLLGCLAIILVSNLLMVWIGILAYGVMAAALTVCVGYWVAG